MKIIAFYLPQFHPIAENDAWWGTGFTEWRNVAAARPRFSNHRQPRLPGELGFYDLRLPETREAQAALARDYGVSAFCYYHYWFQGRRLLERPFEEVLASGEPDFPFCLCWANEPWTRSWSDRAGELLVSQEHSEADDLAHARYLARVFADPRYLRVEGRPVFLIYRASALPSAARTAELFRAEARRAGVAEPLLCRVESDPWRERRHALSDLGFDAAVEFAPNWLELGDPVPREPVVGRSAPDDVRIFDYREVVRRALAHPEPPYCWFRCVTPSWDNSPRRESGALILDGSTPDLYGGWLEEIVRRTVHRPSGEQLVFINAWNEWAEGAYLEPDADLGRAYLEATRRAIRSGLGGTLATEAPHRAVLPGPALAVGRSGQVATRGSVYRLRVPATLEAAADGGQQEESTLPAFLPLDRELKREEVSELDEVLREEHDDQEVARPLNPHRGFDRGIAFATGARIAFDAWRYDLRAHRALASRRSDGARLRSPVGPKVSRRVAGRRPRVLVVSPYPLYPAVSGGSVRISNLLRRVATDFELHLAVFSTTRDDAAQRLELEEFCESVHFLRREEAPPSPPSSLLPRGAEYFAFESARRHLRDLAETVDADIVQLEHTEMGQFSDLFRGRKVVLTELDLSFVTAARRRALGFAQRFAVDGLLWSDPAGYRRLLRYEIRSVESCDQVHVMSEADGELLGRYLREGVRRLRVVDNGVDCSRFRPRGESEPATLDVLFVGSFGHSPNRDAIQWLMAEIWPRVLRLQPTARLAIVGAHPPPEVTDWHGKDGVSVFGTVPETAEFYRAATVLLAPIRAGSGTRLKLLEAFSSGLPVVATGLAAEGLAVQGDEHLLLAESSGALAQATVRALVEPDLRRRIAAAARHLVEERYDWARCADKMMSAWDELLSERSSGSAAAPAKGDHSGAPASARRSSGEAGGSPVAVSVILPTRNGGPKLEASLRAILSQEIDVPFEVLCIDSASNPLDLERMRAFPVHIEPIPAASFNHGLTRDLGARLARGRVLVFLNQDAVPVDRLWLHRLVAPLLRPGRFSAVQGGIREVPEQEEVFYWHSCGPRFYFTSESEEWIGRHGGIGFSTVNAAMRREVWEALPFGWAPILEDKKWQAAASERGLEILDLPEAAVFHSHTYDLRTLWRRVASEGYGWRLLGVRYSLSHLIRDLRHHETWHRWLEGLREGQMESLAERLFPWVRPLALYWGNRWSRGVQH